MCISSVYGQRVLGSDLRVRSKVDVIETISGVALASDGDVFLYQCAMVIAEGSRETDVAYFSE